MSTAVIGLDLSYTGTGIAVFNDGTWGLRTVHTGTHAPIEMRWRTVIAVLLHHVDAYDNRLVVIEAPIPMKGQVAIDLAMLHGVVRHRLYGRKTPVALVQNTHLKLFATGYGRAGKGQMIDAARARLMLPLHSDDQADAAFLAAMALHHYGRPLCPLTAEQADTVGKVAWPTWTLHDATAVTS